MSAKKFKFVSPGVFLSEIDNSQLPKTPGGVGPVVIGRTRRGPALKPVKVSSFQEFVEIFGDPIPGNEGGDPWRDGNGLLAPAYAPLAAQAYLRADINSPVTVIRLLGVQGDDASDSGQAGWEATDAYGLFVAPSSSNGITGSLVGIVYTDNASFQFGVTGTPLNSGSTRTSRAVANGKSVSFPVKITNDQFTISMTNGSATLNKKVSFRKGLKYIREVLNTNPVLLNSQISEPPAATLARDYFLGETFEEEYEKIARENSGVQLLAWTMKLTEGFEDFKSAGHQLKAARTGWVIPQYEGATGTYNPELLERLFRFVALQEGEQGMDFSVRIENIKISEPGDASKYGRFDVVVYRKRGSQLYPIESFESLNLNPNSSDFIARRIGDQFFEWNASEKRNKVYGDYVNRSSYIRVEMANQIGENGPTNPSSVPFGFYGPIVPASISDTSLVAGVTASFDGASNWATGSVVFGHGGGITRARTVLHWPTAPHVITGSLGIELVPKYVFGGSQYNSNISDGTTGSVNFASPNPGLKDHLRAFSSYGTVLSDQTTGLATGTNKYSYVFSLDEVFITGATNLSQEMSTFSPTRVAFISGSHRSGRAFTAHTEGGIQLSASALLQVVDSFSMPLVGGCDGVNILEADPFNMRVVGSDATTRNNYAFASIDRAIELVRDPEALEMNLAAMPGITNLALTKKLVQVCEARADALAIIDLPDVYKPPAQAICTSFQDRVNGTTPAKSARALKARQINSSYGCAYYPWVKVRDTINSRNVWAPPSVIALGVMGYTEERNDVWFAPAGFNRGGLNEGNAGLPVLQASEQLLSSQRDLLYEANINPIASFVSEGLVVFGQKTLQMTPSALDRINVRRLLIFVKKEVSRIANGLLFDQNAPATWNRFTGQVVPFLESVQTRLGLTDFKVVLDTTTTTPDLIDRNIMYAKIFLKPARSIEFIAVDFVITRTGASFDD